MLFKKKIQPRCGYCKHVSLLADGYYLCREIGHVDPSDKCNRFKYDPLKRMPVKAKAFDPDSYKKED